MGSDLYGDLQESSIIRNGADNCRIVHWVAGNDLCVLLHDNFFIVFARQRLISSNGYIASK